MDSSSASCSARVSNDVAHGGTKSVKFIDGHNNGWAILDIQNQFDETEITFWIYMFDTNRILYIYTYEFGIGSDFLALVGFNTDNKIYAYDGGVETEIVATYNKEQWYKMRIVFDLDADRYDVFIDEVLEADDFSFLNGPATSFKACRFISGKAINSGTMGYIDDVNIGELTYEPPAKPNLLFGAGFNDSAPYVELHWNHSLLDVQLFEIQNSTDKISWDYLGNSTTANYTDTHVFNGTARFYRVRACNFTGGSWWNSSFSDIDFEIVYFLPFSEGIENGLNIIESDAPWVALAIILSIIAGLLFMRKRNE